MFAKLTLLTEPALIAMILISYNRDERRQRSACLSVAGA
jgi:hypothetical protein